MQDLHGHCSEDQRTHISGIYVRWSVHLELLTPLICVKHEFSIFPFDFFFLIEVSFLSEFTFFLSA
jgi:hypothetical protein